MAASWKGHVAPAWGTSSRRRASPAAPIVGGVVNGELRELTYPIEMDARVRPVTMGDADGMRIYRRSLTFLLETAFEELFPELMLTVDHSVSSGGYFCQVTGRAPLEPSELESWKRGMQRAGGGRPALRAAEVPLAEAIAYFQTRATQDKVRLLRTAGRTT